MKKMFNLLNFLFEKLFISLVLKAFIYLKFENHFRYPLKLPKRLFIYIYKTK